MARAKQRSCVIIFKIFIRMKPETALRILGLSDAPTQEAIEGARRAMLTALHPDKNPGQAAGLFQRLCTDINEAFEVLCSDAVTRRLRDDAQLEQTIFQVNASAQWSDAVSNRGNALAKFDRNYAKDKIVAVAVLGLDPRFAWETTNGWTGEQSPHLGTALYVLVWNRTRQRVESLDISEGLLVDDQGNQYSSEGSFYWSENDGKFNRHGTTLVPNAKLDGFLLYPSLRLGASSYVRWYLADTIQIGDKYIDAEYDVALPSEPQKRLLLSSAIAPADSHDEEDDLDDDWLYGDK
jgi:hypothetical protein